MNKFEDVIKTVTDIADAYCPGVKALGAYTAYVKTKLPRLIEGSVDIDACTEKLYPNANRWDYVISFKGKAYYLEVHPATAGEVRNVVAKKAWLVDWLGKKAKALDAYPSAKQKFTWVPSGKFGLSKTSREYRMIATRGLRLESYLNLS